MTAARGYAATAADAPLTPYAFERRELGETDIEIETIAIDQVNEAYERMVRSDVRFRFVIDLATLPS